MNFRFKKEKQRLKNSFKTLFRLHDLWVNKSEKTQISDFQKKISINFFVQSSISYLFLYCKALCKHNRF